MPIPYHFPSGGPPNPLGSHFRGGDIGLHPGSIPGGEPIVQINPGGNFNAVSPYQNNNQNYPAPGPGDEGGFRLRYLHPGTALGGAIRDAFHRHMERERTLRNAMSYHGRPSEGQPPSAPTGLHAVNVPDMYFDYASGTMRPYQTGGPQSFGDNPNQGQSYYDNPNMFQNDIPNARMGDFTEGLVPHAQHFIGDPQYPYSGDPHDPLGGFARAFAANPNLGGRFNIPHG